MKKAMPQAFGLIGVQDRYVERVNAAYYRWSHRRGLDHQLCGGHFGRRAYRARREALEALMKLGFTDAQARIAIKDADDVAALERNAES